MKSQDSRSTLHRRLMRLTALSKMIAGASGNVVAKYQARLRYSLRGRRSSLHQDSTYWDGKAWSPVPRKPRVGHWENRSRGRAYAEKVSKGEQERREANWKKSKVGRAVLRRRREGRYPTVQSAEAIRETVEEKRHLTALRRAAKRGTLELIAPECCPYHDLGIEFAPDNRSCPCESKEADTNDVG